MGILHSREQNFHPAKCSTIFSRLNIWEQAPGANWANLKTLPRVCWHVQNEPGACSGRKTPRVSAFMGECSQRVKDRRRRKNRTCAGLQRIQTENALLWKRLKMPTFPNFPSDIFLKTQRVLTCLDIILKTEGSKEFNFWKDFYLALSANYLL